MISALVQTYEKIQGSEVMMAKEVRTVGRLPGLRQFCRRTAKGILLLKQAVPVRIMEK